MRKESESFESVIAGLALIPVVALWMAYVVSIEWTWFVVPLGAPEIGTAHAYGLVVIAGLFHLRPADANSDRGVLGSALIYLVAPAISLGVAAIAKAFM